MKITDIRVNKINKENSKVKAIVSITLDESVVVRDIFIVEGKERLFVSFPSRKGSDGQFHNVLYPIKQEVREFFENEILKKYRELGD